LFFLVSFIFVWWLKIEKGSASVTRDRPLIDHIIVQSDQAVRSWQLNFGHQKKLKLKKLKLLKKVFIFLTLFKDVKIAMRLLLFTN